MPTHREQCLLEPVQCPFKEVGCDVKFTRRDAEKYMSSHTQVHFQLMYTGLETKYNTVDQDIMSETNTWNTVLHLHCDMRMQVLALTAKVKLLERGYLHSKKQMTTLQLNAENWRQLSILFIVFCICVLDVALYNGVISVSEQLMLHISTLMH